MSRPFPFHQDPTYFGSPTPQPLDVRATGFLDRLIGGPVKTYPARTTERARLLPANPQPLPGPESRIRGTVSDSHMIGPSARRRWRGPNGR